MTARRRTAQGTCWSTRPLYWLRLDIYMTYMYIVLCWCCWSWVDRCMIEKLWALNTLCIQFDYVYQILSTYPTFCTHCMPLWTYSYAPYPIIRYTSHSTTHIHTQAQSSLRALANEYEAANVEMDDLNLEQFTSRTQSILAREGNLHYSVIPPLTRYVIGLLLYTVWYMYVCF